MSGCRLTALIRFDGSQLGDLLSLEVTPRGKNAPLSPAVHAAALGLRVDAVTVEVISLFRQARIPPILLKGPSISTWLYTDGAPRPYGDTDLLIEPTKLRSASEALRALGFRQQVSAVSSYTWFRSSDRSFVDLHDTLFGVGRSLMEGWEILSTQTESMRLIGNLEVEVLNRAARLLNVALHAAQHGGDDFEQPLLDLERALLLESGHLWEEAARLATRLQAIHAFSVGLGLHPLGVEMGDRLTVASNEVNALVALQSQQTAPMIVTLERLAHTRGLIPRFRFLARRALPPSEYMRWRYPGLAHRGRWALIAAYVWRPISIMARLPAAIPAWRRARRAEQTFAQTTTLE